MYLFQALQNETTGTTSNNFSNKVSKNTTPQWPVLDGLDRPSSMSMNNILEDAVANMNLRGMFILK